MTSIRKLRSKRTPVNIRLKSGQTAELMAIAMALQASLRTTLEYLVTSHQFREGPWLDDLEKTLVDDASNIWAEGLPLDAELRALDSGRVLIGAIIGALRHQLRDARPS